MKEHEIIVTEGDSTVPETGARPQTKAARTLADWEPTPRVITEEEEELLHSVTVSPTAPHYLRAYIASGNSAFASG